MARKINHSNELFDPNLYYRCADGTLIELVPNKELGLTEEVITVIRKLNEDEHKNDLINERYLRDPRYESAKRRNPDLDEVSIMDKFQTAHSSEPEDEASNNFYDYLQSSGTAIASLRDRDFCRKIATESNTKYRGADVFELTPVHWSSLLRLGCQFSVVNRGQVT